MQVKDDADLLRRYAVDRCEAAFTTIVERHIDLVYSAALRHVRHHEQAQEITQAVFVILARKAGSLRSGTILPAWLFQTTRLTAANYLRAEIRRLRREKEVCMQPNLEDHSDELWQQLCPLLNDAIAGLGEKDRNAVILRFFQGKGYKEVAVALGSSEEAAQMRVNRALEKLRKIFIKRGVAVSVVALGGFMATNSVQAAPVGFAASVAAGAIQGATLTASTMTLVKGSLNMMAWTKAQLAVGTSVVILLACQQYQNVAGARQLAAARQNLQDATDALTVQSNRTAELQLQGTAISDTKRSQEQELANLRARRKAVEGAATGVPKTLLSTALQDPDAIEAMRSDLVSASRGKYDPILKQLNLDPEQKENLIQKKGDDALKALQAIAAVSEGRLTPEEAVKISDDLDRDATNRIRIAAGEIGFEKFEEYEKAYPSQILSQRFERQCKALFTLNTDQRDGFAEILRALPSDMTSRMTGEFTVDALVHPERLNQWFDEQAAANEDIRKSAAAVLTPDQLEALELMQNSSLSTMKRDALRMLRKL